MIFTSQSPWLLWTAVLGVKKNKIIREEGVGEKKLSLVTWNHVTAWKNWNYITKWIISIR